MKRVVWLNVSNYLVNLSFPVTAGTMVRTVWVRHSGDPPFRGSAIPEVRHSGCQPFGDGSVVRRVSGLKGHLSKSFYSVNVLAVQWVTLTW